MPRKSRRKQPVESTPEPVALADPLEAVVEKTGLIPATQALKQLPPPQLEAPPPQTEVVTHTEREPVRHAEGVTNGNPVEEPSFAGRLRPNGPRILPAHVKIIHDGRGDTPAFEMGEDHEARKLVIDFRADPGQEVKDKLTERRVMSEGGEAVNFQYDDRKKVWHTDATPDGRDRAYEAANEISGKDVRFGFARGR